jgi:outer membrane protein OmpA-like peptidoglycan-associated protein
MQENRAMKNLSTLAITSVAALMLSACGMEYNRALEATPSGSAFDNHLYKEYIALAGDETGEADHSNSDIFAMRAIAAAAGNSGAPEEVASRDLPAGTEGDLQVAHATLLGAFAKSAKEKIPDQAARAQAMYECWMEEQEENIQPDDIAACRAGFDEALAEIAEALTPFMAAAPAPAPAPAPEPEMAPLPSIPGPFVVHFGFDDSDLDDKAMAIIASAASAAKAAKTTGVAVTGHTDLAGGNDYNMTLSRARVLSVRNALVIAGGAKSSSIVQKWRGEESPRVSTPDGKPEAMNRRVVIIFTR